MSLASVSMLGASQDPAGSSPCFLGKWATKCLTDRTGEAAWQKLLPWVWGRGSIETPRGHLHLLKPSYLLWEPSLPLQPTLTSCVPPPDHTEGPDICVHRYWAPTWHLLGSRLLATKTIHAQCLLWQDLPMSSMHMRGLSVTHT